MDKANLKHGSNIKCDDIVRYPIGWTLAIRKVYSDDNGDLYTRECINTKNEYKRYLVL